MRGFIIIASMFVPICACGARSSPHWAGVEEQPVYPLRVHPALSGTPPPPDARAPGRGTRGSPTTPPLVSTDYPDPPEVWATPAGGLEEPIATGPRNTPRRRDAKQR